jgi:hypothetical protein
MVAHVHQRLYPQQYSKKDLAFVKMNSEVTTEELLEVVN